MVAERHLMVLLCAACTMFNYADRVNMSVVILSMAKQYGWSTEEQATVMSSFFIGYLLMQVGGALLARRFGGKAVLGYGAALWSLFTALTPLAAEKGFKPLLACRFAMGVSEGVAFPTIFHFLAGWIPSAERGRAISTFITGCHVGTTIALLLSPHIISWHSWQMVFYLFGGAGVFWIAAWVYFAYDKVMDHGGSYSSLKAMVEDYKDVGQSPLHSPRVSRSNSYSNLKPTSLSTIVLSKVISPAERRAMTSILTTPSCLAVCFTQFSLNLCQSVIISWLPTYFSTVHGVNISELSFTAVPYISMALCCNLGGWGADYLITRGMSLSRVRKIVQSISCLGAALFYILFSIAPSTVSAVCMITGAMVFMSITTGGFESSYLDMASPQLAGTFKSIANSLGAVSGCLAMPYTTVMLWVFGGSWRGVFASLASFQLAAMFVFARYSTARRVLVESVDREEMT